MEPNNMAPETSGTQGQSVTPTGADAIEQALAEANVEVASAVGVPMDTPAKKSGHGMLIGLILCILLAIGGIGFGVWAMIDGNTQKTNFEKQISELRAQNNKLLEQLAEGGDVDIDVDVENGTSSVDPEDYIYVGEWGLKIKKPETLVYIDYKFDNEVFGSDSEPGEFVYEYVGVRGVASGTDMNLAGKYLRYADSVGCYNAMITRVAKTISDNDKGRYGTEVFSDNSCYYMYQHGQVACSNSDELTSIEESSNLLIIEMLSNSDNYSKI